MAAIKESKFMENSLRIKVIYMQIYGNDFFLKTVIKGVLEKFMLWNNKECSHNHSLKLLIFIYIHALLAT